MWKTPILSSILWAVILWAVAAVATQASPLPLPEDDSIHVQLHPHQLTATISIRAEDGRVAWSDVLRGLARARGNDDTALQGIGRNRRFRITGTRWRTLRLALNLALKPNLRFDVVSAQDETDEPRLLIGLDRVALLASKRRIQARLRDAWLRKRPSPTHYGLVLDEGAQEAPVDQNLVVVVHGLDSSPERTERFLKAIRHEGLPCGAFRYPNDQPIADSAKLLACELAQLGSDEPRRNVSLVTTSMGGLVARAAIEDPQLDPGNVTQLIMIAPPNHGSALARFGFALDVWEHVSEAVRRDETELFYSLVEDGLSEAAGDLRPGSPLLRELNARPRNPRVRYAILLGTSAPLRPAELQLLRNGIAAAGERSRWVRFFGARVHVWLADLDEIVDGKGDGAVSLQRGRLEGVEDTVLLQFAHVSVLSVRGRDDVDGLLQEVLKRLKPPDG